MNISPSQTRSRSVKNIAVLSSLWVWPLTAAPHSSLSADVFLRSGAGNIFNPRPCNSLPYTYVTPIPHAGAGVASLTRGGRNFAGLYNTPPMSLRHRKVGGWIVLASDRWKTPALNELVSRIKCGRPANLVQLRFSPSGSVSENDTIPHPQRPSATTSRMSLTAQSPPDPLSPASPVYSYPHP